MHLEVQHLAQYLISWKMLGNEFLLSDLAYMIAYAKHAYMSASGKRKASEVRLRRKCIQELFMLTFQYLYPQPW